MWFYFQLELFFVTLGGILFYLWKSPPSNSLFIRRGKPILLIHAIFAGILYFQTGSTEEPTKANGFNEWEFFHYYLGAKYAPELGYYGLYEAVILADLELGAPTPPTFIRDLKTGQIIRFSENTRLRAKDYRSRFSPEQWNAFRADVLFFKERLFFTGKWERIVRDKGYNATPVWSLVVGLLSNSFSIQHPVSRQFLASLDLIMLALALLLIFRFFGMAPLCLIILFLGTHPAMSHSHLKWAYLRLDWLVCLLFSVCALKKRYFGLAGALTAYASLMRIFPITFTLGIGTLWLIHRIRERKWHPEYSRYLGVFFFTLLLLIGLTTFTLGTTYAHEFVTKIQTHDHQLSLYRVGFKMVFLGTYQKVEEGNHNYIQKLERTRVLWWTLQLVVFAFFVVAICRLETLKFGPEAVQSFSFVLCYFLFAPTFYYMVILLIPLLFFLVQPISGSTLIGIFCLFLSSFLTFLFHDAWGYSCSAQTWYSLSTGTFVVTLWMYWQSKIAFHQLPPTSI